MDLVINVGVSSCLLGNSVRYDGGHKRDRYITETLDKYFQFVPVCPEVECGLTIPREAMHLIGDEMNPRLVTVRTEIDHTEKMSEFCSKKIEELAKKDLCGFIFKSKSPSSGLYRVKIYQPSGNSVSKGRGLFAAAVADAFPVLPLEEEGRLHDAQIRENFIERVFSYRRWKDFSKTNPNYKKLVNFHTKNKLLVMAHSPRLASELGNMVAHGKDIPKDVLLFNYEQKFMEALSSIATVKKNTNVLQHIMGHLRTYLTKDDKAELLEIIRAYSNSLVPLTVPLTLVNHYIRKYDVSYLKGQVYLAPHPSELMLRNHV